jgi:hypothetical protein
VKVEEEEEEEGKLFHKKFVINIPIFIQEMPGLKPDMVFVFCFFSRVTVESGWCS